MPQSTLWVSSVAMNKMVNKIMGRLAEVEVSAFSPYAEITHENCEQFILDRLKKEIEEYGSHPASELNNFNLAFVFGLPLNDTVFMLTGCLYPGGSVPTIICNMMHNAGPSDSYSVDFYHLL